MSREHLLKFLVDIQSTSLSDIEGTVANVTVSFFSFFIFWLIYARLSPEARTSEECCCSISKGHSIFWCQFLVLILHI